MADAVIDSNSNGPSDTSPSDPSHDANEKQPISENPSTQQHSSDASSDADSATIGHRHQPWQYFLRDITTRKQMFYVDACLDGIKLVLGIIILGFAFAHYGGEASTSKSKKNCGCGSSSSSSSKRNKHGKKGKRKKGGGGANRSEKRELTPRQIFFCTAMMLLGTMLMCSAAKESGGAKVVSRGRRLGACNFKLSDDPSLASTDGWNVLSESCVLGDQFGYANSIKSGKTLKVKKNPLVSGPVVIDRQATSSNQGQHFYVYEGSLEMEGVTLKGGYSVSFFCCIYLFYFFVLVHICCVRF